MPPKVKIILNPMADMGNAWRVARDLRSITAQHGNVTWSGTVYPGHAIELAREASEEGYERIIAMGGDGTVHSKVVPSQGFEDAFDPFLKPDRRFAIMIRIPETRIHDPTVEIR